MSEIDKAFENHPKFRGQSLSLYTSGPQGNKSYHPDAYQVHSEGKTLILRRPKYYASKYNERSVSVKPRNDTEYYLGVKPLRFTKEGKRVMRGVADTGKPSKYKGLPVRATVPEAKKSGKVTKASNINTYRTLRHIAQLKVKGVPQAAKNSEKLKNSVNLAGERANGSVKQLVGKRDFSDKRREKLASKGDALPDGSFPIPDKDALRRARMSIGRSKDPAAARALIDRRAKELGVSMKGSDINKSAFGVEHEGIAKAQKRTGVKQFTGSNASAGRKATGAYFSGIHGAVAGKPGKKLRAMGSEAGGALTGSAVGAVAGARFGPIGSAIGSTTGSLAGGLAGTNFAQNRGFYGKQPGRR